MNTPANAYQKRLVHLLRGGIRYRLFLLVTLIILPFAALLGFIYHQRYEMRRHDALDAELEVARGLAATFNTYLNGIQKQNFSVGHAISILPAGDERIVLLLRTALHSSPSLRSISWVSARGVVLASTSAALVGKDIAARPTFPEVLRGKDLVLGDMTEAGVVTPRPTVTVSTAIRDNDRRLLGVISCAIDPAGLHAVVLTQKRPEGGALSLFDRRGTLVYHSILTSPSWQRRISWRAHDTVLSNVLRSGREEAGIQQLQHLGNVKWVSARVPLPELGWVAGAGRPAGIPFERVREGVLQDGLFGAAVFALAFILAYLLGRSITSPLLQLEEDARVMGEGTIVSREDPLAPTEVHTLRNTIATMATSLLRRSEDLRESEVSMRTIFDNVYDGIVIHDVEGRIVDANRRWMELMRVRPEQVAGLTVFDASAGAPTLESVQGMWKEVLKGQTRFFEWDARRPGDGSRFDSESFLCGLRYKGRDMIMGNIRDITERRRVALELQRARDELEIRVKERTAELAEAFQQLQHETAQRLAAVEELRLKEQQLVQQSRIAAMGEMMGNVAHHWRQPLNVIGLMVQDLLLSYQMENITLQEMEARTEKIMASLSHLSHSIDYFRNLFISQAEKAPFDPWEMVEKAIALLGPELQGVQVTVESSCSGKRCIVEGFAGDYLQVILNVLSNARDVLRERQTAEPRILISISIAAGRSVVTIADNGGGIPEDIMPKIFDPYFTTKDAERGTGIGLFMSKTIIEKQMGGTLTARNTAGGAEFTIMV